VYANVDNKESLCQNFQTFCTFGPYEEDSRSIDEAHQMFGIVNEFKLVYYPRTHQADMTLIGTKFIISNELYGQSYAGFEYPQLTPLFN